MTYFCSNEFVTGHIEAKKGYWHMVFNNGVDNMKKRIRWSKTTGLLCKGNKRKAEAMLRSHLEQANSITLLPDNMKFYELIEKWIEYVAILVEENTHVKYQYAAKHLVSYFQRKAINVQQLKPVHISDYYVDKIQRIDNGQGLSPNTLLTHRTVMIGALKFAIDYLGIITDNVVKIVPPPKKEVYIPMFYNEIQINEVFRKVQDEIIAPAIYLAASYGLRRSEVLGIKWDAIDFERKTITIRHTVTKVGNKDVAKDRVKTKASLRSLYLTEGSERYLKKLYLTHLKKVGASELANRYVCCRDNGKVLRPDFISRKWKKFLEVQGFPHIRFHDLRHSAASIMIDQGLSLVEVQAWLGHAKLESTLVYIHLYKHSNQKIADKLDQVLYIPA